jgi:hypothetical protein
LILLASFPIAMSQTSALCKLIAIASSASNYCKYLVSRITILPHCPPQKRNRNGSHLLLHPRISPLTENESVPLKRPHPFLRQKTSHNTSSAGGKRVSVEGPLSLTRTPSASIKPPTPRVCPPRPISWLVRRKPSHSRNLKRLPFPRKRPQALRVTPSNLHQDHRSSAKPRKDPSEIDCWTCGQRGHYSGDCPSNTKRESLLSRNKPF